MALSFFWALQHDTEDTREILRRMAELKCIMPLTTLRARGLDSHGQQLPRTQQNPKQRRTWNVDSHKFIKVVVKRAPWIVSSTVQNKFLRHFQCVELVYVVSYLRITRMCENCCGREEAQSTTKSWAEMMWLRLIPAQWSEMPKVRDIMKGRLVGSPGIRES